MREKLQKGIVTGFNSPADPAAALKFQDEYIKKSEISRVRSMAFERRQRLPYLIQKGLAKPGTISFDILRRAATSVHVARICVNALKEKVTKTEWVIQNKDPQKKPDKEKIEVVEHLFKYPNQNNETFRTLLDKVLEDLLVLDFVGIEKTRFEDGSDELAGLHYVDASTIRPVFDDHGNQDVQIPITDEEGAVHDLPVSYVQVIDSNPYGGRESGQVVALWPKRDFINFMMHPQGSMSSFGYGLSPLEAVVGVVANILNADNFNGTYFEEGSFPPVIIHLKANMSERELQAAREYLYQELEGHYHRPAIVGGDGEMEIQNLKDLTQRDMQFMDYMTFMATLLAAAYGLSKQDIGLTEDLNHATADVQKDLSQAKGYGSILGLLKEIFNNQIIWNDFGEYVSDGYKELEFEWVSPDTTDPEALSNIIDRGLRNGTLTINQTRQMRGDEPYGNWADKPMLLTPDGFIPLDPKDKEAFDEEQADKEIPASSAPQAEASPAAKKEPAPVKGVKKNPFVKSIKDEEHFIKSVQTDNGEYEVFMDDRGVSQPFIFYNILTGQGRVVKPPVAVNLDSQKLEEQWTHKLFNEGLHVVPVKRVSETKVYELVLPSKEIRDEFIDYQNFSPAYSSKKWEAKYGTSRKFPYYIVSKFIDGRNLKDPLLIDDMKRVPKDYYEAIDDLVKLWLAEKKYILGDRRADQYIITSDKRAWGFDYQFVGNESRWKGTKDSISNALNSIPELRNRFMKATGQPTGIAKALRVFGFNR